MKKTRIDFDKAEWMIDRFFSNRLILAGFLILDGIFFLLNPAESVDDMGRSVGTFILLASGTSLITGISEKLPAKALIPSASVLLIGGVIYLFPAAVSMYLRLFLSFLIILNGLINIMNVLGLKQAAGKLNGFEEKVSGGLQSKGKHKEFSDGIGEEKKRYFTLLVNITEKVREKKLLYLLTNMVTVVLGICLLTWKEVTATAFGFVFLYTGLSDLLLVIRVRKIGLLLKERKIKEILFEDNNNNNEKS